MKKIAVFIADGSEEIEALTPVDVIRRTGAVCHTYSVNGQSVKGSHGIEIKADFTVDMLDADNYDALVIPGGMPGAVNIAKSKDATAAIEKAINCGKIVAAICASPAVVLGGNGLLACEKATCYPAPDFIGALGEKYTGANVEKCANFITANGPKSAMEFSLAICAALELQPKF